MKEAESKGHNTQLFIPILFYKIKKKIEKKFKRMNCYLYCLSIEREIRREMIDYCEMPSLRSNN